MTIARVPLDPRVGRRRADLSKAQEEQAAAALGYAAHVAALLAVYLDVPLRYPVYPVRSRVTLWSDGAARTWKIGNMVLPGPSPLQRGRALGTPGGALSALHTFTHTVLTMGCWRVRAGWVVLVRQGCGRHAAAQHGQRAGTAALSPATRPARCYSVVLGVCPQSSERETGVPPQGPLAMGPVDFPLFGSTADGAEGNRFAYGEKAPPYSLERSWPGVPPGPERTPKRRNQPPPRQSVSSRALALCP